MVLSPNKIYLNTQAAGLTLIEVLIALAIVGIALLAVIKAVTQTVRASSYLQQKTLAAWAGLETANKIRAGMPDPGTTINSLAQTWYLHVKKTATPNPAIKELNVFVYQNENALADGQPIITLESYVYQPI